MYQKLSFMVRQKKFRVFLLKKNEGEILCAYLDFKEEHEEVVRGLNSEKLSRHSWEMDCVHLPAIDLICYYKRRSYPYVQYKEVCSSKAFLSLFVFGERILLGPIYFKRALHKMP